MMRTFIQRPSLIFEEFLFRTFADAKLTSVSADSSKPFCQSYDVLSLAAHIIEAIEDVADKVKTEPTGFLLVGRGGSAVRDE